MLDVLRSIIWYLLRRLLARSPAEVDIVALRHLVAVLQRQSRHRSKLTRWDRLLFAALYRVQPDVLRSISIVRPETVVPSINSIRRRIPSLSRGRPVASGHAKDPALSTRLRYQKLPKPRRATAGDHRPASPAGSSPTHPPCPGSTHATGPDVLALLVSPLASLS